MRRVTRREDLNPFDKARASESRVIFLGFLVSNLSDHGNMTIGIEVRGEDEDNGGGNV